MNMTIVLALIIAWTAIIVLKRVVARLIVRGVGQPALPERKQATGTNQ